MSIKTFLAIMLVLLMLFHSLPFGRAWEIERPSKSIEIGERTENSTMNSGYQAAVGLGVWIDEYQEDATPWGDYFCLNVTMTANSRIGVEYAQCFFEYFWWIPAEQLYDTQTFDANTLGDGDDVIFPVDLPNSSFGYPGAVRFYGGGIGVSNGDLGSGSAIYRKVYISTNGFVSFDNSSQPSPVPSDLSEAKPNELIAACWTDLVVDANANIIVGSYTIMSKDYFVIIWNNTRHKASGERLTFEIILEDAPGLLPPTKLLTQSDIFISWKDVGNISACWAVGIEDYQGVRGSLSLHAGSDLPSYEEKTEIIWQTSNDYFLKRLTLSFRDELDYSAFDILEEDARYRSGNNIHRRQNDLYVPDPYLTWADALGGTATLLISALVPPIGWLTAACLVVDGYFITANLVEFAASRQYSGRDIEVNDMNDGLQQEASAVAFACDYVCDAEMSIIVFWVLNSENAAGHHSLNATATLEYSEYSLLNGSTTDMPPISTSVTLEIGADDNNSQETAYRVDEGTYDMLYLGGYDQVDYYVINVNSDRVIEAQAVARQTDQTYFNLSILDEEDVEWAHSGPGRSEFVHCLTNYTGDWFIRLHNHEDFPGDHFGFYNLSIAIKIPGDINGEGRVNAKDAVLLGVAFGSQSGDPGWNPNADINNDGFVNAKDAIILGAHFGEEEEGCCKMPESGGELGSPHSIDGGSLLSGFSSSLQVSPTQNTFYTTTKNVGDTFDLSIVANSVSNLYGWEFGLSWTPGLLNCTAQTINENVWSSYLGPWVAAPIDNVNGLYHQSLTAKAPASSFNGTVWLVNLTFQIVAAPPEGDQISTSFTLSASPGTDFCLFDSSALDIPHDFVHGLFTYISPRHMRSDTHTINGLQAYKLGTNQTTSYLETNLTETESNTVYWGIRVWKRTSAGAETEITSSTPVAQVSRSASGYGIQSATWNCLNTTLTTTDSIVIRVYCMNGGTWTVQASFTTKQLNAQRLNPTTWKVYYWTKRSYVSGGLGKTVGYFRWGTSTYNSRIENFTTSS